MRNFLRLTVAACFLAVFLAGVLTAGCKSGNTVAARLAVSYATAKYIEKAGPSGVVERVQRIRAMLDTLEKLSSGEMVTIDALKAYVAQRLDHLSPADRVLAGALIDAAVAELEARVGSGVLDPEKLVKVREVLAWVREGTNVFAPPTS